jgi:uncharacterized protein YecT (DUF1311 family)
MAKYLSLVLLVTLALFSTRAQAENPIVSKNNPCVYENGAPVTGTSEMIACASKSKTEQELLLNKAWQCVVDQYSKGLEKGYNTAEGYNALLAEQKAWEKFRDSACLPYTYDFGREGHIHFVGCRAALTLQRAQYLNGFMDPSTEDTCLGKSI